MSHADAARLKLFQLVSPALPVGAFSYSEGLEVLVQQGLLAGPQDLEPWLRAELQRGAVAMEAAALGTLFSALRGGDLAAVVELDGWLLAQREAAEVRAQQRQMGQSLLLLLADLGWPLPGGAALAWPAAFAWAALCLELGSPDLEEAYLYSWVANQISAAVRLVPLGPTQGQRLQLALAPLIAEQAAELSSSDPGQLWNGGIGAGLAQLQHAELYSRLFRS
ncbi:urease accessory protein UreF [Synechococcus sp. CBW1107]|uniref:urease accessory protein UreF n=1 Tax=Synechococcus sp. CBW1107 TaxID=2789857 RepID=UPI002AD400BE|nr:urease accessory UreF family protein [Synechococcus sp. CBW1107]CAK6696514.1 Urease accessory protein UreF [Synechococcus sp. CBW1107]